MFSLSLTIKDWSFGLPIYDQYPKFPNEWFCGMGGRSFLLAFFIVVLTAILLCVIDKIDKKNQWFAHIANKCLIIGFAIVWLLGFMVYDIGMYTGEPWSLLGNVPMAIIHAFGMFVFNSDVSEIHDPFHNNGWFMAAFSITHFLAAVVSLIFVLKHFGFHVMSAIKRRFAITAKDTTYVFWGMNDATYYLAKDIHQKKGSNSRIVIVRTDNDQEATITRNGFERILSFLSLRSKDLERLRNLNCITTNTHTSISNIETNNDTPTIDLLRKKLHLASLCRLIEKKTNEELHIFLLSENEKENIQAAAAIKKDATICRFLSQDAKHMVKIYCHARYNSIHRVIEDELLADRISVKVIDSSHINIELLKKNVELQPVSFVNIENNATVSSPFNSLVVGFSEVGKDAVSFLYEFGAFVKSNNDNGNVKRSEFCCHVVDKNMKNLAGQFVANAPSIKPAFFNGDDESPTSSKSFINLHHMDCQSVAFYQKLEEWMKENLNYVVICTENDEFNMSLAVRIFKLAIRYRETMENFCILVRVHRDDNGHIRRVAEHYNRLWAAELHSIDKKTRIHQKTTRADAQIQMPIYLFGLDNATYTYNNIVSDRLEKKAKQYKAKYDASIKAWQGTADNSQSKTSIWENEHKELMQLTDEYKGYSPTYSGIMRLRRIQSQDIANSLHIRTKRRLAYRALGEKDYAVFAKHQLIRKENEITYSWKSDAAKNDSITNVLHILAQTEHLRWNASHELLGYRDEGGVDHKDEARLQHGCLKKWEDLSPVIQSYDYNVVDVSLGIIDLNSKQ